jgi:hypothetical protein
MSVKLICHLREGNRLRMFENSVPRRVFGLKKDERIGGWRKLHGKELRHLYSSPDIVIMKQSRTMI